MTEFQLVVFITGGCLIIGTIDHMSLTGLLQNNSQEMSNKKREVIFWDYFFLTWHATLTPFLPRRERDS